MAEKSSLDKLIAYVGILVSVFGILFVGYFFLTFSSFIDTIHQSATSQVDSGIAILMDAKGIVSSTADSIDSLTSFAGNASTALNQSADAMEGVGTAIDSLASSLGSIPYMSAGTTAPLYSAASGMDDTADSMRETAGSMANVSGNAISTAAGVQSLEDDIDGNVASLEGTRRQLDEMHSTAKIGLILGSALVALLFVLNGLSFYRQLRE